MLTTAERRQLQKNFSVLEKAGKKIIQMCKQHNPDVRIDSFVVPVMALPDDALGQVIDIFSDVVPDIHPAAPAATHLYLLTTWENPTTKMRGYFIAVVPMLAGTGDIRRQVKEMLRSTRTTIKENGFGQKGEKQVGYELFFRGGYR